MTSHVDSTTSGQAEARVFVAIEVRKRDWVVAGHTPIDSRMSRHRCRGGDVEGLVRLIERLR